jgi:hypothetical protein
MYLSANKIATKFTELHNVQPGQPINIKLTHKQSNWLMRQAGYDKQYKNNEAWGVILDNNNNEIGQWYCSKKHMRSNVFVLEVRLHQTSEQKQTEQDTIKKQVDGLKLAIDAAKQHPNSEFIISEMEEQISRLLAQIN